MADPASIPAPNYTQIPNAIFELMADKDAHLTEAELRVILAIARKTFGWHKKRDKISLSQLETLTAMSRNSVIAGLEAAVARGLVRKILDKKDKRGGFFLELVVDEPNDRTSAKSELVQNLNQSKNLTRSSANFEPDLVQILNPQKKEKEKKERGGDGPALTPAVQAYFDTFSSNLKPDQVEAINSTVTDLGRWQQVLKDWSLSDWKATNVRGMLDRYSSGRTVKDERPGGNGRQQAEQRPSLPVYQAPKDRPPAEQSRKSLAEKAKDITL